MIQCGFQELSRDKDFHPTRRKNVFHYHQGNIGQIAEIWVIFKIQDENSRYRF